MKQITQLENVFTALKQVKDLIVDDCKNACDMTINQSIALAIISTVLCGKSWKVGVEVKEVCNG